MKKLIADGVSIRHLCILTHLMNMDGEDYLNEIVNQTGVSLSNVRRMPVAYPLLVEEKTLERRKVFGSSRPIDAGLKLTNKGKKYLVSVGINRL